MMQLVNMQLTPSGTAGESIMILREHMYSYGKPCAVDMS